MLKTAKVTSALVLSMLWADSAFALSLWDCVPVPEIDASSGIAAIALIMSVGAVIHRKVQD